MFAGVTPPHGVLEAAMSAEQSRGTSMPTPTNRLAQVRWWGPSIAIAGTSLVGGLLSFVTGEPIGVVLCLFTIAIVAGTGGLRARTEFRRGWRSGYESAVRVAIEGVAGRTTALEVRASVHGDPTPEPWEEHVPLPRPGGARR
jgi:hypothetical protein